MEDIENKYTKAAKRVKELKDFYRHLKIFIAVNAVLYLMKAGVLQRFLPEGIALKPYYFNWVDLNLVIWMVILAIHTAYLFRHKLPFLQKWEERQIQKYLEEEEGESRKYR